jgi:deoxyribonucleoside regulator
MEVARMERERGQQEEIYWSIDERRLRAAAVAQLYHLELINSWSEIAGRLDIDRRLVPHLLKAAHENYQLVDVRVHHPLRRRDDLAARLRRACPSLRDAVVVETPPWREHTKEEVGRAAARRLDEIIGAMTEPTQGRSEIVIAVSWGSTLAEVAKAPPARQREASVVCVPTHGSTPILKTPHNPLDLLAWQANAVARCLAERLRGVWYPLNVPALVRNPGFARWLETDTLAAPVLALARRADIVLVGMGTVEENAAFYSSGAISKGDLQEIRGDKGVGHICGRFFRLDGQLCRWGLEHHILGLGLEDLRERVRQGKVVMGVVGGREKSKPLLGGIRARAVNYVVTDAVCCEGLLRITDRARRPAGAQSR